MAERIGCLVVTVSVANNLMAVSVTSSTPVAVAVFVEEKEADQVDGEAGAPDDQHQLWVFDFLRGEKFLEKRKKRTSF